MGKIKEITLKTKGDKIVEQFKECFTSGNSINLKTNNGYIYYSGGILCKMIGNEVYTYINDKWVRCV